MLRRIALLTALWLVLAGAARADVVVLEDGRILVGPDVEETERGVLLRFEGGEFLVPREKVHAHFEPDDPVGRQWLEQDDAHRRWRNRRIEKHPEFTFESTLPALVDTVYRNGVLDSFREITDTLGVERPPDAPPKVCMHRTQDDFRQIGGAGGAVEAYFRFVKPLEIAFYDDVTRRELCLRGARWAVVSYALYLAYPRLRGGRVLSQALEDYYAAGVAERTGTGAARYGVVDGAHAERLRRELAHEKEAELTRLTELPMERREAWAWSLVHFLMQDEALRERFQKALPTLEAENDELPATRLAQVLGLEDPDAREAFCARWHAHVRTLVPARAVELARAAEVAELLHDRVEAQRLYRAASGQPTDDTAALRGLATILEERRREEEATEAWRAVLAKDPFDLKARDRLGWLLVARDEKEEGKRELALAGEIRRALEREE